MNKEDLIFLFSYHSMLGYEDPRLQNNMEQLLAEEQLFSQDHWVLYFYKKYKEKNSDVAKQHLSCYLQTICKKVARSFAFNYHFVAPYVTIHEYSTEAFSKFEQILKKFNIKQDKKLKAFASRAFKNAMRDRLRQEQKTFAHSDNSLLRHTSYRVIQESLKNEGKDKATINNYVTACSFFKKIYGKYVKELKETCGKKIISPLPDPNEETWKTIVECYNSNANQKINEVELKRWMNECVLAIRNYRDPPLIQINDNDGHIGQQDDELQDMESCNDSNWSELHEEIDSVLCPLFEQLEKEEQQLLEAYYIPIERSQREAARKLGYSQGKVSYKLKEIKEKLLEDAVVVIAELGQSELTSEQIYKTSKIIDQWLDYACFSRCS